MTRSTPNAAIPVDAVDPGRLWRYLAPFSSTVRTSGSSEEAAAFDYAQQVLAEHGYEIRRLGHPGYVSVPGEATATIEGDDVPCIPHAMAAATDGTTAPLASGAAADLRGRIAVSLGIASPGAVRALVRRGARGAIFINAEQRYEMIVSPVWGSPDDQALAELPSIPVVSVTAAASDALNAAVERGADATLRTRVTTEWRTLPLLEATLAAPGGDGGMVLFSGHIDAWHLGAMDNGAANATMLEVATVMARHRDDLVRDLRILFWSGHSHGRYAGSQWYADNHDEELRSRALVHVNIDSVGGRGASDLTQAPCMPETFEAAATAIADESGQCYQGVRYGRAGDQSFWGHGVSSVWMGLSEQPSQPTVASGAFGALFGASRAGGFGWWWHTPEDTIDKVDEELLARDCRAYLRLVHRLCTEVVAPLQFSRTARDLREHLEALIPSAGQHIDLTRATQRLADLEGKLADLEAAWAATPDASAWRVQKALARHLVPLEYVAGSVHEHDPALAQPPVPRLATLRALADASDEDARRHVLVGARRKLNDVEWRLREALDVVDHALERLESV